MESLTFTFFNYNENPTNAGARWKKWIERFNNFLVAIDIKDVKRKKALLLHYIGEEMYEIYNNLPELTTEQRVKNVLDDDGNVQNVQLDDFEATMKMLDLHFAPKVNTEFEIFSFRNAKQQHNETVNQFYSRLLKFSEHCDFADRDKEIKSQIIATTTSTRLRDYAFQKRPTLQELLAEAQAMELSAEHNSKMVQSTFQSTDVHFTKARRSKSSSNKQPHQVQQQQRFQRKPQQQQLSNSKCNFCGNNWHNNGLLNCPARNKTCKSCGKQNHFSKVCLKQQNSRQQSINTETHQICDMNVNSNKIFNVTNHKCLPETRVNVNGDFVNFTIDTGSTVTLMSRDIYEKFSIKPILEETRIMLMTYESKPIATIGKFTGKIQHKNTTIFETIYVAEKYGARSLLSFNASIQLSLIQINHAISTSDEYRDNVKQQFPEIFNKIGKLKDREVHLFIDPDVMPLVQPTRGIPFHLREKVENELKRLEHSDIIEKVTKPSPWISPIVIVPRPSDPDSIRVCVDMRAANKAIKRVRHITPTLKDILALLNGSSIFSKIDLKDGYHQLVLDESSRAITTFSTHCGIYQYKRLNFGINTASEIFQNEISQLLIGIQGVINISDDILVFGKSQQEHDETLKTVLTRIKTNGLTINENKCAFNQPEIKFFGFVLSANGFKPDPDKVKAFANMKAPTNVTEVRSILGMINFVLSFIPDLPTHTEPLRELTRKNVPFVWTEKHINAFNKLKVMMSQAENLAFYNLNKETHLHVDAGPIGLSAILSQHENNETKIISYASRVLSTVEKRYSHIEKEMLAVSWGMEYFHMYLYGIKFVLHTDSKSLVSILKNPTSKTTARIERLMLKIQQYEYDVIHQIGITNPADYFSRHPSKQNTNETSNIEEHVNFIVTHAVPYSLTLNQIQQETAKDKLLQQIRDAIVTDDWSKVKQYKTNKLMFSLAEDCILKSNRIVIPNSLVNKTLELAHKGHLGIVKTKQLLRTKVWFPNMDKIVEHYVKSCPICQATGDQHKRDPIQVTELTSKPFEKLAMDFIGPVQNGKYLLVIVDDYSRFPFIETVNSTSFVSTQTVLSKLFSTFGIPEKITSDNGPPFNSYEFAEFSNTYNFKHQKITPVWPEANGQAERCVKTIKKSLMSAYLEDKNCFAQLDVFLMNYRSTPHSSTGLSPYELLFNRKMNNFLPSIPTNSKNIDGETIYKNKNFELNKKMQNKSYADQRRHVKQHEFKMGDEVLCKQKKISKLTTPFDPNPYKISKIKGSQITAKRENKAITRNSSFFKKFTRRGDSGFKNFQHNKYQHNNCKHNNYHNGFQQDEASFWSNIYTDYDKFSPNTKYKESTLTQLVSGNNEQSSKQSSKVNSNNQTATRPIRTTRGERPKKFVDFI